MCQTDLSFAEADGRLKASLLAREQTESARIGEWEERAALRMRAYREALARHRVDVAHLAIFVTSKMSVIAG